MSETHRHNHGIRRETANKIDNIKLDDFDMDYFKSLEGEGGWIALGQENCTNQRYFTACAEDGEKIGIVGVYDTEDDKNIIHYVIRPEYRGQGLSAKCTHAIIDTLNLPSVIFTINLDNTPSLKAVKKIPGIQKVSNARYENDYQKEKYVLTKPEKI